VTLGKAHVEYNKYLNNLAVFYAFLMPLSRAGIVLFSGMLLILWVLEGEFRKKYLLLSQCKVVVALLLFICFNLLSILWSDNRWDAFDYVLKYWYFLSILVFFTSLKKEYISKVMSAFILGMFISEIISYGIFFEFFHFNGTTSENPSPFMHHIEYSIFLAFTALVLLNRIFNEGDFKYKLLYTFFFITMSGNLFLTAGRTGQFAFVLGLFVLALLSFKNKIKAFSLSIVLSIIIVGIAFNLSNTFNERVITGKENLVNVVKNKDYCTSWGGRVGAWILSKDIILKNPFIGAAPVDNMIEFHTLIDNKYPEMKCMHDSFMHVHNQYLQIFTQLGIVGLIIFLSLFYFIGTLPLKDGEYSKIKYIYLTVIMFAFISEVIMHRQFSMALFALIVGLLIAQYRTENEV